MDDAATRALTVHRRDRIHFCAGRLTWRVASDASANLFRQTTVQPAASAATRKRGLRERSRVPPLRRGESGQDESPAAARPCERHRRLRARARGDPGGLRRRLELELGGGGSSSAGAVKRGGTGVFGITSPAQDVDPVTMFNTGSIMTTQLACDYLVFPDEKYVLQPRLATKWAAGSTPDIVDVHDPPGREVAGRLAVHRRRRRRVVRPDHRPQGRLGRALGLRGRAVQGQRGEGRRADGQLPPRPAVRRLPVPRVVVQLQLGRPAGELRDRHVHEGRDRNRAVHPEDVLGRPGRDVCQEPDLLGRGASVPGRRADQVLRRHAADRPGAPGRVDRRLPAGAVPGVAGPLQRLQHHGDRDALERVPDAPDAGRPGPVPTRRRSARRSRIRSTGRGSCRGCSTAAPTSATTTRSRRSTPARPRRPTSRSARRTSTRRSSSSRAPAPATSTSR